MAKSLLFLLLAALTILTGCAHLHDINPGERAAIYLPQGGDDALAQKWAPAFVVHNPGDEFNRIGRPRARLSNQGIPEIWVDPWDGVVYYQARRFTTGRASYTNLIYRVHFPATPYSLWPFFIGAGNNMGILVVITLDHRKLPVLVTTNGTCGCYTVSIPTNYTPQWAYPPDWSDKPIELYGEKLPARIDYQPENDPQLVLEIRPAEHRVMDLKVISQTQTGAFDSVSTSLQPAAQLRRLPLDGGQTSMFYNEPGLLKGHVKGAYKPWETLLLGVVSMDMLVGMDKVYGDPDNPFYTSIKPWNHQASDMNNFPTFLKYWGWGL